METIFQVHAGTKRHPSCRQDEKINRKTTLCYTSIQQNKGLRPLSHQLAHRQEGAAPSSQKPLRTY